MDYKMSYENENRKRKIDENIKKLNDEWTQIEDEIMEIKKDKNLTNEEKIIKVKSKEIVKEEIESNIACMERGVKSLYVKEMIKNLEGRHGNGEITKKDYSKVFIEINHYKELQEELDKLDLWTQDCNILEMKLNLEKIKKSESVIPKEEADFNIGKIESDIEQEYLGQNKQLKHLQKIKFTYDRRKEYKKYEEMVKNGEITESQLIEKISEFSKTEPNSLDEIRKEQEQEFNRLAKELLSEKVTNKEDNNKEKYFNNTNDKKSDRDVDVAYYHKIHNTRDKIARYPVENLINMYSREMSKDDKILAEEFAKLEIKGYDDADFWMNPYTDEYGDVKTLLEFEKVEGLNIEGIETNDILNQDIYVAQYDVFDNGEYRPIKEYYIKDKNNKMQLIGSGTDEYTSFEIEGIEEGYIENNKIVQGKTLNKVTKNQLEENMIKSKIEETLNNEKIKSIEPITNYNFSKEFLKQCGNDGKCIDGGLCFYIISTMDKQGKENYELIYNMGHQYGKIEDSDLGITKVNKDNKEMKEIEGIVPGKYGAIQEKNINNKQEYITKDGHRYAITRNEKGELGFNKIVRENENDILTEKVGTTNNNILKTLYKDGQINKYDLKKAYNTINRTKDERKQEQNEIQTNNFESR